MKTNTRKYLNTLTLLAVLILCASCSKEADRTASGPNTGSDAASTGPAGQQRAGGDSEITKGRAKPAEPSLPKNHGPRTPMMATRLQDAVLLDIFEAEGAPVVSPGKAGPSVRAVETLIGYTPVIEVQDPSTVSGVMCGVSMSGGGSSARAPAEFWQSGNRAAVWDPYAGFASVRPRNWDVYRSFHDLLNEPSEVPTVLTVTVSYQDAGSWKCSFHRRNAPTAAFWKFSDDDYGRLRTLMDSARSEAEKREGWKPDYRTTECGVSPLLRGGANLYQVIIARWDGSRRKVVYDAAGTLLDYSREMTFPNPMDEEVLKMWELGLSPGP